MFDPRVFTFMTLYQEMNYRRTAEKLNMTQPGVTQHIQRLEKLYGVRLFTYEGRTLHRTPAAETFKRHLDSMMAEERAMRNELAGAKEVTLSVGATKTIGEFVLVPTVQKFLENHEHRLNYVIDNTETLLQMLEDHRLDFAVIEGVVDKSRYGYQLFKKEKFVGICHKNHRFAGKKIPLEDVFRETLLIREQGSGTRRLLEQAICDRGYSLNNFSRVISLNHFSVIMKLLERGDSITFAYRPIVQQRDDLTTFSVRDMQIEGEFNFVYCNQTIAEEQIRCFFH